MLFDRFLKTKKGVMLFLLPIVAAAMVGVSCWRQPPFQWFAPGEGIINLGFIGRMSVDRSRIMAVVCVLVMAYLMFVVNARWKFLSQSTTLPCTLYLLLTVGLAVHRGFDLACVSAFLFVVAMMDLQELINDNKSNRSIFRFGLLTTLAIFFYPKALLMLLWAFCALLFSGRSTLRDISAFFLGIVTPLFVTLVVYFWMDELSVFGGRFRDILLYGGYPTVIGGIGWFVYGLLAVLLIHAFLGMMVVAPIAVVSRRRSVLSLFSMCCFCLLSVVVIPGTYPEMFYLLFVPLSYLCAQQLINQRIGFISDLFFSVLVAIGVVFCGARFF